MITTPPGDPGISSLDAHAKPSASPSTIFGFNEYVQVDPENPQTPQNIKDHQMLGANIAVRRMFVYWENVEPADDQWDWKKTDAEYNAVESAGLQLLIVAQGSPSWARSEDRKNRQGPPNPDGSHDDDWKEFIQKVIHRYPAVAIEIWNEPNLGYSFYPVDATEYVRVLNLAYDAVKDTQNGKPTLPVISGGLPGLRGRNTDDGGSPAESYIKKMYNPSDSYPDPKLDGLGIHIYPTVEGDPQFNPAGFTAELATVKNARPDYATEPIWITEVGESTEPAFGWALPVTPAEQAEDLMAMIDSAEADPNVAAMMLHTVDDDPAFWSAVHPFPATYNNRGFGVFRSTSATETTTEPKPAACAISARFGGSLGPNDC